METTLFGQGSPQFSSTTDANAGPSLVDGFFAEERGCSGLARGKLRLSKGVDEWCCWGPLEKGGGNILESEIVRIDEPAVVDDDKDTEPLADRSGPALEL